MLRLATIYPNEKLPLYVSAVARTAAFEITHVVAGQIDGATCLDGPAAILRHAADFDACVVHSPVDKCHDLLKQLADLGKRILFDSSHLSEVAELDQLSGSGKTDSLHSSVTLPRRFTPYARTIHESLSAGHLGREGLVRIHRWERDNHQQHAASPSQLRQLLSEEIDLTCWLFDGSPTSVFGQDIKSGDLVTGTHCHLGFADGMALIDCAVHDAEPYYCASLIGSRGAAYADDHHNTNLLFGKHTAGQRVHHGDDWWRLQLESFAAMVEKGTSDASVSDLRRAMLACDAAVESAKVDRSAILVGAQYELQ